MGLWKRCRMKSVISISPRAIGIPKSVSRTNVFLSNRLSVLFVISIKVSVELSGVAIPSLVLLSVFNFTPIKFPV